MEHEFFKFVNENYLKWNKLDGIFTPGGSIANLYALICARYNSFPNVKNEGVRGMPDVKVFTSESSHYSIAKGANILGLGLNSIVKVKVNDHGMMIPEDLDEKLSECKSHHQ